MTQDVSRSPLDGLSPSEVRAEKKTYQLDELRLESTIGVDGVDDYVREVPVIDLSDFDIQRDEISEQLWNAATQDGFFQLTGHGISREEIEQAFIRAETFFALPESAKSKYPLVGGSNAGWESLSQVRPSTGTADQKESYQITRPRMKGLWPDAELPEFREQSLDFEARCWEVGMRVLSCFASKLGFSEDFFFEAHDPNSQQYQSTLRLLHYYATDGITDVNKECWRAGAHTDFDCLTLLFQRTGQGGLQVCPGKEAESHAWTSVTPETGVITCNIGDMLMRWSDDKLLSNLHRVKMPGPADYQGARYTIAFFCQADKDKVLQGPEKKYPPITAGDYIQQRIAANFDY